MEDIIPLLIVVLISIVGAATRKKKKRVFSEDITEKRNISKNDDFLSWMERVSGIEDETAIPYKEIAEEEVQEEIVEEKVVEGYHKLSERKEQYSKSEGFISSAEREALMAKEAIPVSNWKKDHVVKNEIIEDEIGNNDNEIVFDLRKAVIYNEILNRKYS